MLVTLPDRYLYKGRFYGPGEADAPEGLVRRLYRRGVLSTTNETRLAAGEGHEQIDPDKRWLDNRVDMEEVDPVSVPSLTHTQNQVLWEFGFTSRAAFQEAEDDDLLAVSGIGPGSIKKIREWLRDSAE